MKEIYDSNCKLCSLCDVGNRVVCLPGRGDPSSHALIIGEAPGAQEDEKGEPFVGLSGGILNSALAKSGVSSNDVYITNAVKCRPPGNRTPDAFEIESCFPYLYEEVRAIKPVVMMPLGNVALQAVTAQVGGITKKAGLWKRLELGADLHDALVLPNYHPAYVNRNKDRLPFFEEVVDDFVKVWKYALKHTVDESWSYAKP